MEHVASPGKLNSQTKIIQSFPECQSCNGMRKWPELENEGLGGIPDSTVSSHFWAKG